MNKKIILILLFILTWFNHIHAQEWQRYSDSIYSNIQKNNISKAEEFLNLAKEHIDTTTVVKDTIYADYLYHKGLVAYNLYKEPLDDYHKAINIWENSKFKNYYKIMKLHYFIARHHFSNNNKEFSIYYFEKCYVINKNNQLKFNPNYNHSISFLMYLYYQQEDFKNAAIYAQRYIELNKDKAYQSFDFNYPSAFGYAGDVATQEMVLLEYLKNYEKQQLTNPELLLKIHSEIMSFYSTIENYVETIKYGEKALLFDNIHNVNYNSEKNLIYTVLISAYSQIGDNINQLKFKQLLDLYYPDENDDYYNELENLIIEERYEEFEGKFKEYETLLIAKNDYNELLSIYALSLNLYERSIIFNSKAIDKQINQIVEHKELLNSENKLFLNAFLAEYLFFNQEYLKALNICNNNLEAVDATIKLLFYKIKELSERFLGLPESKATNIMTIELAKQIYNDDSPQLLPYLILGIEFGDHKQASKTAIKALEIIYKHKLEHTGIAAQLWGSFGRQSFKVGNYKDASIYYHNAININDTSNPFSNYSALCGLAKTELFLGNYTKSLEYLKTTKELIDGLETFQEVTYGDYYSLLGDYYFFQDHFSKAKESYLTAFDYYGPTLSKGRNFNFLLCDYFINGDVDGTINKLETYYKDNGNLSNVLKIIYLLKFNTNKNKEARELLLKSLTNLISQNNSYFHLLSDSEREVIYTNFTDQFEFLNTHLLLIDDTIFLKQYVDLRFYFKSLLFYNSSKDSPQDKTSIEDYQELKNNTVLLNTYYEQEGNYSTEIDELLYKNRELEKFLSQNKNSVKTPTLEDAKNGLKPNEAYVEIIRINKQSRSATKDKLNILNKFTDSIYYGALIIKHTGNPKFILIDSTATLESIPLKNYQHYINGKQKFKKDSVSHALFFKPIETHLNTIDTVYLVSDGIYNAINVETFYNPERKNYVIDYLNVKPILSIRSIVNRPKMTTDKSELTATIIGNPEFELTNYTYPTKEALAIKDLSVVNLKRNNTSSVISYLPGTEKEINSIERILSKNEWNTKAFQLEAASEDHLKVLQSPRVLHIATHGYFINNKTEQHSTKKYFGVQESYFQTNTLLKSGLLFSGAQNTLDGKKINSENNGILTAQEAKQLNLKNTELVVLSACETGLGNNVIGEGVYGLQRAFMIAGAQSIIMSLWSVNDSTTEKLMTNFYTYWIDQKIPKQEAFKKAKLKLKESHPEPFYWAPFILIE